MTFKEDFLTAVDKKNGSTLCAGYDPAKYTMGRGEKGLQEGVIKLEWGLRFIEAVAQYCSVLKINTQYMKESYTSEHFDVGRIGDMESLAVLTECAHSNDMVVIEDAKLADIGDTNEAGVYHSAEKAFDAVTYSPFAGNMEQVAQQGEEHEIGIISMCLMSNPEFKREKNNLVKIGADNYRQEDMINIPSFGIHTRKYIQLAHDAKKFNLDAVVVGAPSEDNHVQKSELEIIKHYIEDLLVLIPGIGAQGGSAEVIWKYFAKDQVIVSLSRGLMFPEGSGSTPEQHAAKAKWYFEQFEDLKVA